MIVDLAVLSGSGAANNPEGIENDDDATAVTHTDASGLTFAQALAMETALATNNALMGMPCWFMSPADRAKLRAKTKVGSYPVFLISQDGMMGHQMLGYPVKVKTNGITSKKIIFGNFQDAILASWGMLSLKRDEATHADRGGVVLRAFVDIDTARRHSESFVVSTGS